MVQILVFQDRPSRCSTLTGAGPSRPGSWGTPWGAWAWTPPRPSSSRWSTSSTQTAQDRCPVHDSFFFCPNNKYFLPTKLFLFDQIEFPEFCDMMASKMSDNDDEEAVRWEQLFSRKTFISLQLSTGTFALAFSHIFTSFQILAMISGESLVLFTAILLLLLIKYDLRSPPSSSGYKN